LFEVIEIQVITKAIVKEIKKLHSRKYREEMRLFLCEGSRLVGEVASGKWLVVSDGFEGEVPNLNCPVYKASERVFKDISTTENSQGIMAVCGMSEEKEFNNEDGLLLILDRIADPGNLGTIIRAAEAAAVLGVVLSRACVDLYNPKVVRSTMGAIFRLPIWTDVDLVNLIEENRRQTIAMVLGEASENFYNLDIDKKASIIIGNEASGISADVLEACDVHAHIPQAAGESLNAAMAAGIACFEWRRKNLGY